MSTLKAIFGDEHHAYFSNGSLERLGFLRMRTDLLDKASMSPSARYLPFENLFPLRSEAGKLAYAGYKDVEAYIGRPYGQDEKTQIAEFDPSVHHPTLVFLGLDPSGPSDQQIELGAYRGVPYFALDVTPGHYDSFKSQQAEQGRKFTPPEIDLDLPQIDSAIFSHARSMIDWNLRNRHCSACGGRTLAVSGGAKMVCPPADAGVPRKTACPTRVGLHNQAFPRTDPVMVIAPISADSKRVLLGRGKRWPENYFSALSGFVEPGESLEVAARREAFEETGVRVDRVQIHSSQPWPYPSTLLVGSIAQCKEGGEEISYPESELDEAKWFELAEIEHALDHGANARWDPPIKGYVGPRVPPRQLMAHQLLRGVLKLFHK